MVVETSKTEAVLPSREAQELARLRRELEEARQRLEEETAYYRAELEASRRRRDRDSTLLQADEVARRRRAEEQLREAQAELRQSRAELAQLQQQYEQLHQAWTEQQAEQASRERALLEEERRAAREVWREAEREAAVQERELEALRQLLQEEQKARQQATALAAQWEQQALQAQQTAQDANKLVVSLKKALWNTAHARRRAETALVELRAANQSPPTEPVVAAAGEPASASAQDLHTREDGYNEVSQEALKTIFFGDVTENLTDEFLLTTADASLDRETVGQLRAVAAQPPLEAPPPPVAAARPAAAVPARAVPQAEKSRKPLPPPLLSADQKRHSLWRLLLLLGAAVGLAVAGYWFLAGAGQEWLLR